MHCKEPNQELYQKFIELFGTEPRPVDRRAVQQRLGCSGFEARNLIAHRQRMAILQAYKKLKNTRKVAEALGMTTVYVNGILSYYGARIPKDNQYSSNIPPLYDPNNIITKYLFSNKYPDEGEKEGKPLPLSTHLRKIVEQLDQPSFSEESNEIF